jgi:hypothetical protein
VAIAQVVSPFVSTLVKLPHGLVADVAVLVGGVFVLVWVWVGVLVFTGAHALINIGTV